MQYIVSTAQPEVIKQISSYRLKLIYCLKYTGSFTASVWLNVTWILQDKGNTLKQLISVLKLYYNMSYVQNIH